MESFISNIRSLYQQQTQQQNDTQKPINYNEIYNTINSNLDVFNENSDTLLNNVIPNFSLPEYTLPHMAIIYAIITKSQSQAKNLNEIEAVANLTGVNEENLLHSVEICLKNSDPNQVLLKKYSLLTN